MHPLETGDSHKVWTENRGQVNLTKQQLGANLGNLVEVAAQFYEILINLAQDDAYFRLGLLVFMISTGGILLGLIGARHLQSHHSTNPPPQFIGGLGQMWLFGLLSTFYFLLVDGYRLLPSIGADRISQIVWVQRLENPEFAAGDLLLEKGDPLREAFARFIWFSAGFLGLEGAYFALSLLFSVLLFGALAFTYLAFVPEDFTSATLFAFLATFFTWGRFGYPIAAHSGAYQFDLIPRVVAVTLIGLSIGHFMLRHTRNYVVALVVGTLAVLVQPVTSIVAIGTFLFARFLSTWFTPRATAGPYRARKALLPLRLATFFTVISSISSLGMLPIFSAYDSGLLSIQAKPFVSLVWLSSLICFLTLAVSTKYSLGKPGAKPLGELTQVVLFLSISLLILILGFGPNPSVRAEDGPFSFSETLELYDLALSIRSPEHSILWNDQAPSYLWVTAFLLVLGWLFIKSEKKPDTWTSVNFYWIITFLLSVLISAVVILIPGLGGGNVLWPISSSYILIVAGLMIILQEELLGNHRNFFFVIVAILLLVIEIPSPALGFDRLTSLTNPGLALILLMIAALYARRIRGSRMG